MSQLDDKMVMTNFPDITDLDVSKLNRSFHFRPIFSAFRLIMRSQVNILYFNQFKCWADTVSSSIRLVTMAMMLTLSSQIIRQKASVVLNFGPWAAMNSLFRLTPCQNLNHINHRQSWRQTNWNHLVSWVLPSRKMR